MDPIDLGDTDISIDPVLMPWEEIFPLLDRHISIHHPEYAHVRHREVVTREGVLLVPVKGEDIPVRTVPGLVTSAH